jgi:peptide/nickel transport system ATP-binding protein
MTSHAGPPLLAVTELGIAFHKVGSPPVPVVDRVSFGLQRGEAVALVGESGCGKSITARALLGLLPATARVEGAVHIEGTSVYQATPATLRHLRGARTGFVFQDPGQALNPVYPVGEQIAERLRTHGGLDARAAWARATELLAAVGIPEPALRAQAYPHQLSGGMRQRVVLAIALAGDPALLIADEPTTALDVTLQAQILALIREHQRARGLGLLLISHDLGVVAQCVDRVLVMYAGRIVEEAPVIDLFEHPRHPYTRDLLRSLPGTRQQANGRLYSIPGSVPSPGAWPPGCPYAPRCDRATAACAAPVPFEGGLRCLHPVPPP